MNTVTDSVTSYDSYLTPRTEKIAGLQRFANQMTYANTVQYFIMILNI